MKDKVAHKLSWARFRLQVIGPLLASPAESGELQGNIRELSERVYRHPLRPEKSIRFGFSTIERWYYQTREAADPIEALTRKGRRDAGRRRRAPARHTAPRAGQVAFVRDCRRPARC